MDLFVRIRTEEVRESYRSAYAVSETESEDDGDDADDADDATPHLRRRASHCADASARLSSSSGLSASLLTSSSDADADSGIDGVSPRLSVAGAFGEATLSPSHSILYIDSVSARNSVAVDAMDAMDAVPAETQETAAAAPPLSAQEPIGDAGDVIRDDARPIADEGASSARMNHVRGTRFDGGILFELISCGWASAWRLRRTMEPRPASIRRGPVDDDAIDGLMASPPPSPGSGGGRRWIRC